MGQIVGDDQWIGQGQVGFDWVFGEFSEDFGYWFCQVDFDYVIVEMIVSDFG